MSEFLGIQVEIFAGVIIPATTALAIITWRAVLYLINKEICFKTLKQIVTRLDKPESDSGETHGAIHEELNYQSNRITALETKMDILLKHFNLKSD